MAFPLCRAILRKVVQSHKLQQNCKGSLLGSELSWFGRKKGLPSGSLWSLHPPDTIKPSHSLSPLLGNSSRTPLLGQSLLVFQVPDQELSLPASLHWHLNKPVACFLYLTSSCGHITHNSKYCHFLLICLWASRGQKTVSHSPLQFQSIEAC